MRFATIDLNGAECAGIFQDEFYSFEDLFGKKMSMLDFIRHYENTSLPDFQKIISEKKLKPTTSGKPTLKSPIPIPFRNVICLGKNYADHAKEIAVLSKNKSNADYIPKKPVYFAKSAYPAVGDGEQIPIPGHITDQVDYEVELAVIIGKTIRNIEESEVENAIFGYTILNDVTARDMQASYGQWFFGKSLDGFCPIGPVIVSKDEIPFPIELDLFCRVNGETRQKSNTSDLIFDIPKVISELSQGIALYPGDIIATGTPAGVAMGMQPPKFLQKGDTVECEIEKIGILTNTFV